MNFKVLRAVIYARCSTEEESQIDALRNQVEEAKTCVVENGWTLIDVYVESRSGTTTKGRKEYNRLYEDLLLDKFDIIIIKSQDRLMRNTKDWYLFIDRLSTEQKKLYMYMEKKFYSTDDALLTGIKAILAEEYSRELSKKINNAHKNRQKNNGAVILTSNTYGYRKLTDKSVVIVEEEAEIKRRMYELCAAGFGSRTIAAILQSEGILNRNGKPFTDSAILRIIHNPLNKGTAVMNRLHYDFESKQVLKVPEEEQFVYENKVPAIVSEELWEAANQEIAKRVEKLNRNGGKGRGKNPGKFQLSGKLYCGLCGSPYYRRTRKSYKDRAFIYEWKCKKYLETGRNEVRADKFQTRGIQFEKTEGCNNVHINEETLYKLLKQVCEKDYKMDKEKIIGDMVYMLKIILKEKDYQTDMNRENQQKEKILEQMNVLVDKLLEGVLTDDVYQKKQKELEQKLQKKEGKIQELEKKKIQGSVMENRIFYIKKTLQDGNIVEKAIEAGMLEEVEKILIYPEYMEVQFKFSKERGMENLDILEEIEGRKLKVQYGNLFNYKRKKVEEREIIIDMMKENPQITAKIIAEKLGISLSGVQYKIKVLKKEGRIRFSGKGGKGYWKVLK